MAAAAVAQTSPWEREALALASSRCTLCHGLGLRVGPRQRHRPCECVLRRVFRACHAQFRRNQQKPPSISQIRTDGGGSAGWNHTDTEYSADFYLVARRELEGPNWQLFRLHFLLGADSGFCCRKLHMDRGQFFHVVYRIEERLGRVYRELRPYGLFPIDEYYSGG